MGPLSVMHFNLLRLRETKIAVILQTTFPSAFSHVKFVFWFKFHWDLFPRIQLIIPNNISDNGLVPNGWQAIIWTIYGLAHWRICVTWSPLLLTQSTRNVTIWRRRSWSVVLRPMAWCQTAPSYYLQQYWMIIAGIFHEILKTKSSKNLKIVYSMKSLGIIGLWPWLYL